MSKIEIRDSRDKHEWDGFVAGLIEANFLQSWDFYEFHLMRGKEVIRRLVLKDDEIVGAYAGVVETAKRGRHALREAPRSYRTWWWPWGTPGPSGVLQ